MKRARQGLCARWAEVVAAEAVALNETDTVVSNETDSAALNETETAALTPAGSRE